MNPTMKAILARCGGNSWQAVKYCVDVARQAKFGQYPNVALATEYENLAVEFRLQYRENWMAASASS